jgi:hypothetical protein
LVTNDTAVLRARPGATAPEPSGLSGSSPWARCSRYSRTIDATEKASSERA